MGKAAAAVLTAAAPEAAIASRAAGRRRPRTPDPRVTAPGSKAAQQRASIEQIKASRPPEPVPTTAPAADSPSPTSSGGGLSMPSVPSVPAAVSTGSGVLLGVFVWAGVLAYLEGGMSGVGRFFAAKFFNKTAPSNAAVAGAAAAGAATWRPTA